MRGVCACGGLCSDLRRRRAWHNESAGRIEVRGKTFSGDIAMAYVIAEPCIGTKDSACVDACPVDCIHPKKDETGYGEVDQLFIDPVECIDCGACVPVCPVSAIYAGDDLPEKWASFQEKNATHFGR
jgi:NAD-dependent dihydropyrimidine dehydrogenase PreA subunit